ncbi:MAG: porin family protein [Nitrosomonas sp.]|nr:porin family protein [Nitrosomonas sp.]
MKTNPERINSILVAAVASSLFSGVLASSAHAHDASAERVKELESQLRAMQENMQMMQNGMQAMQSELNRLKSQPAPVVRTNESIQTRGEGAAMAVAPEPIPAPAPAVEERKKNNMVFFRGGFAHSSQHRNGMTFQSDVVPVGAQDRPDKNAWYFGAGFDFNLTNDAWGLAPKTSLLAELMFEYKEFSSTVQGNALANMPSQLAGGALNPHSVSVTQLSVYASPKVKFMEGSRLRPWIIPAGFGVHIVSPPGESGSFFIPGVVFGGGAEYRIWKDLYAGIDARYHITGGKKDGVDVDGLTAGGYLGIGF